MAGQKEGLAPVLTSGLAQGAKGLAAMAGKRLLSNAAGKIGDTTQRLTDYTDGGGGPGLMAALTGGGGGGKGGGEKSLKVTNILEWVDVGVPIRLAYNQWTQFTDYPSFMKKVEAVEQIEDTKLKWKAQIFLSHREWESTIVEQVPDRRIVWESQGKKGSVDGAVTFHELGPELTRICLNLQYHPQGFFEHVGNTWRAQGRRARLEFKHYVRHMMNEAALNPDDVRGWRGEIHDREVVKTDEDARKEEEEAAQEQDRDQDRDQDQDQEQDQERGGGRREAQARKPSRMDDRRRSRQSSRDDQEERRVGRRERA